MTLTAFRRLLLPCALFAALALNATSAFAASKKFTFPNKTGQQANDLHVEFDQGVTPKLENNSYGAFSNYNSSPGSSSAEFDGGTVADKGNTAIRFENTGNKITIKKWWWTKDGERIGEIHKGFACAAMVFDQVQIRAGEVLTMSLESIGGERAHAEFMVSSWVMLPDRREIPLAPIWAEAGARNTCTQQIFGLSSQGLASGEYVVEYFSEDLESGLVTEGSSTLIIGEGCVEAVEPPEELDGVQIIPRW